MYLFKPTELEKMLKKIFRPHVDVHKKYVEVKDKENWKISLTFIQILTN